MVKKTVRVFSLLRRGVRVVEGARLESVCALRVPRVRIPPSPPAFAPPQADFGWQAGVLVKAVRRSFEVVKWNCISSSMGGSRISTDCNMGFLLSTLNNWNWSKLKKDLGCFQRTFNIYLSGNASKTASGCFEATCKRALAGPLGSRLPCSQF